MEKNKELEIPKKQLPTLQELHHDIEQAFKNDQLNTLLNQPVPERWIKEHPVAKNVRYLPIDKVEFMLKRIFQEYKIEVLGYSQIFNSVACHVRLHYLNPLTGVWSFHDGLGAVGVQTEAGASAADMLKIKSDAVMKALPAAESYAIKDAAEKLGTIFGADLNRKDTIAFMGAYDAKITPQQEDLIDTLLQTSTYDLMQRKHIKSQVDAGINIGDANKFIEDLKLNQQDRINAGLNYNHSDINKKISKEV